MVTRKYNVGELRRIIKESTDELKPVMYNDDNEKINRDAYKEAEKKTKAYDGGARVKSDEHTYPMDDNYGMEDLFYNNMNPEFKKKVKSQLKGYTSSQAEELHKNDPFGNAEFHDFKGMDKKQNALKKGKDVASEIGLTNREVDKKTIEKLRQGVFNENKINKLTFKNTTFLTENHMLSKVPDSYKVEGKKFIMRDKMNNEFLVEWHNDDDVKVLNKTKINEEQNRIKQLFNYKSSNETSTCKSRLTEDNKINDMVNKARALMK